MVKTAKFGGSSVAGPEQFRKVKGIVGQDPERQVIVVSAAGKRDASDHKLTDLLYLCHAHITYGVSCEEIAGTIFDRLIDDNSITLWCCGDQIRKGAASNAVQIMRFLVENGEK